jgi:hypothetical protein
MGKQAMVSHPDAETSCDPPQQHGDQKGFPAKNKQCCHCAGVEDNHEEGGYPHNWLPECSVTFEESWISHNVANTL